MGAKGDSSDVYKMERRRAIEKDCISLVKKLLVEINLLKAIKVRSQTEIRIKLLKAGGKTHPCYQVPKNLPQVCLWYGVLRNKTNSHKNRA